MVKIYFWLNPKWQTAAEVGNGYIVVIPHLQSLMSPRGPRQKYSRVKI